MERQTSFREDPVLRAANTAQESKRNWADEAHFWLNGYVNKQNCRIWSDANPQVYAETPLHPEKLTVSCALWAGGIIGPYFFKNDEGHNVTVNGDRYRAMITNFFIPELNNHDVQELWFQQDGATCHTARPTIDLLKDTFGDRLISRFGPVNWPPRSCDLTPLDYFLWGYVKSLVYADTPQTLDHLEDDIRRVIADIRPQMLEKVIENWTSRLDYIRASPMPEIIFKMPLPTSSDGNNNILDVMDYFTKWPEAYPIFDQEAPTVAVVLVQHWISRYGSSTTAL
ncbi:transposable element Tc3 transposase [Trichonephila clavipes]|nr:transposable element Tc3 transposase [Trichonephila clavipes]